MLQFSINSLLIHFFSLYSDFDPTQNRIKLKWTATKTDPTNGGYTQDTLRKYLQKYGDINVIVMSSKRNGSALVEFNTREASDMAIAYEKGNMENPLTLEWIGEPPKPVNSSRCGGNYSVQSETIKETDFESLVLRQMRQAEERKKLIEQMMKEEGDE